MVGCRKEKLFVVFNEARDYAGFFFCFVFVLKCFYMQFTSNDLDNLSTLARINIKDDEKEEMIASMQAILGYVGEINSVSGSLEKPEEVLVNIVREDVVTSAAGSNTEALLANAPATEDGYVKVAQVLHTIK